MHMPDMKRRMDIMKEKRFFLFLWNKRVECLFVLIYLYLLAILLDPATHYQLHPTLLHKFARSGVEYDQFLLNLWRKDFTVCFTIHSFYMLSAASFLFSRLPPSIPWHRVKYRNILVLAHAGCIGIYGAVMCLTSIDNPNIGPPILGPYYYVVRNFCLPFLSAFLLILFQSFPSCLRYWKNAKLVKALKSPERV